MIYAGSGNDRSHGETLLGLLLDNGSDTIYGGRGTTPRTAATATTRSSTRRAPTASTGARATTPLTADGTGGDTANGGLGTDTCTTDANDTRTSC